MNSKVCLSDFMHIDFTGTLTYRLHVGADGQPPYVCGVYARIMTRMSASFAMD